MKFGLYCRILTFFLVALLAFQYFFLNHYNSSSSNILRMVVLPRNNSSSAALQVNFQPLDSGEKRRGSLFYFPLKSTLNYTYFGGKKSLAKTKVRDETEFDLIPSEEELLSNNEEPQPIVSLTPKTFNTILDLSSTTEMTTIRANASLPHCPKPAPDLKGDLRAEVNLKIVPETLQALSVIHGFGNDLGGFWKPPNCIARDRVAIIVPFRDREEHLRIFLHNLHPILKRQCLEYNIFIIEQSSASEESLFNRAMLFNVGFVEAPLISGHSFDCFIFHDVDLIPENDKNLYDCPQQPRHMSVAIDKMNYRLPYKRLFGGIAAMKKEHFEKVNGFSNSFWGWGGEDDDMANRIAYHGLYISRPPPNLARYKMLKHKPQKLNNNRYKILVKGKEFFKKNGLSNLNYTIEQIVLERLFTLIRVKLKKV